jgi:CDP-diacylglycerol---glycerol-3-phosphate 3-phosphatidyltransferase
MPAEQYREKEVIDRLRQRWLVFLIASAASLASGFVLLWKTWGTSYALRWLPLPVIMVLYLGIVLRRGLVYNLRAGETRLLPDLGWGNVLTLLRGLLVALMSGFLFLPYPAGWLAWVPGILYVISCAADFLDGYVARLTQHTTRLGEILDMSFDGLGVLAASLLVVQYGQAPAWYILVGLARYLFLAGLWVRRRLERPIYEMPPRSSRRIIAGLQMGFLGAALLPVFSAQATNLAAVLFGLPLLIGFMRDWGYVSGVLHPGGRGQRTDWQPFLDFWLPVAARVMILALNLGWLWVQQQTLPGYDACISAGWVVYVLAAAMVALGVLPRAGAGLALGLLSFYGLPAGLTAGGFLILAAYTLILYLGGGGFSLWAPEKELFRRRPGEKRLPEAEQSQ